MFQIGPVVWLQGYASPALSWLMAAVTQLGYSPVYEAVILLLAFAVRLRPALGIMLCLLLAVTMTEGLKTAVAFPRPGGSEVRTIGPCNGLPTPLAASDDGDFWSLPSAEARVAVRATPRASYGFPSGHVGAATAFCLGAVLFLGGRPFIAFALGWPLVMGLSRMYLGCHFMADVVGGLAVGAIAAGSAVLWLHWLDHPNPANRQRRLAATSGFTLGLAILSLFTPLLDPETIGRLAGLICAYGVLMRVGFPADAGGLRQRASRFAAAVLIYLAISRFLDWTLEMIGWEEMRLAALLTAALILSITVLGGVALGRRLRWYRGAVAPDGPLRGRG